MINRRAELSSRAVSSGSDILEKHFEDGPAARDAGFLGIQTMSLVASSAFSQPPLELKRWPKTLANLRDWLRSGWGGRDSNPYTVDLLSS
jgi:hypothetical protein